MRPSGPVPLILERVTYIFIQRNGEMLKEIDINDSIIYPYSSGFSQQENSSYSTHI